MSSPTPQRHDHNDDERAAAILEEAERERQRIVRALSELGFALPGTITERLQRCGKKHCACWADPPQLHGPYLQWSRAVKGKTVTKVLTPEQLRRYQPWFDHGRRLRELAHELNELSLTTIRTLERWGR
jgi:hypothetical protein